MKFVVGVQVCVTDVLGGGKFYVQTEEARVASIQKTLESLRLKDKPLAPGSFVPKDGDLVIARFSSDNSWNRALVSRCNWVLQNVEMDISVSELENSSQNCSE